LLARAVAAQIIAILGFRPIRLTTALELGDERLLPLSPGEAAERCGVPTR